MPLFGGRRKGEAQGDDTERMRRAEEAERSGLNCLRDGNLQAAVVELERCVDLNPQHAVGHGYLGLALYRLGKLGEAEQALQTALHLAPQDEVLLRTHGMILEALGRLDEAGRAYQLAIQANPLSARAHAAFGVLAVRRGDLAAGEHYIRAALALDPQDSQALGELAEIRQRLGDKAGALVLWREALRARPQSGPFRFKVGLLLEEERRYDEAIAELRQAHDALPRDLEVLGALGRVLMQAGRDQDVQPLYERTIRAIPEARERLEADLYRLLVEHSSTGTQTGAAVPDVQRRQPATVTATRAAQPARDTRPTPGEQRQVPPDVAAAIARLEAAVRQEPGNTRLYRDLSIQYMRAGRMAEAKEMARQAEQLRGSGALRIERS